MPVQFRLLELCICIMKVWVQHIMRQTSKKGEVHLYIFNLPHTVLVSPNHLERFANIEAMSAWLIPPVIELNFLSHKEFLVPLKV